MLGRLSSSLIMQKSPVRSFLRSILGIHSAVLFASTAAALSAFAPSAHADLDHWTVANLTNLDPKGTTAITGNATQFLAVGYNVLSTSPDGVTWTSQSVSPPKINVSVVQAPTLYDATTDGSQFVAVGQEGTIITSPDGVNWEFQDSGANSALNSIAWNGSSFIVVGGSGTALTSPDGVAWTSGNTGGSNYLQLVAATPTLAVAEGCATTWLFSANGGATWTAAADHPSLNLYGLVASDSTFVAFGNSGCSTAIFTSTDGSHWTNRTTPISSQPIYLNDMLWTGHEFVGVGSNYTTKGPSGVVISSPDGVTWTVRDAGGQDDIMHVGQSGNLLAATSFDTVGTAQIAVAPTIVKDPVDVVAAVGDNVTFTVVAGGTGPFTYKWLKGSTPVSGGTKATLTLKNVATGDAGKYSVVVTGPGGNVTSDPATLKVVKAVDPVFILVPPAPLVASVGSKSTLSVKINATATAPVTYLWNKGKTPLKNAAGKINGATTDTLIFKSLAKSDAGLYNVTITNPAGSVTSVTVRVTVR